METGALLLAIDAGGSNTRAAVVDHDARCLGYGVASSGNATAVGVDAALGAIGSAARRALEPIGADAASRVARVVLAAAGERGRLTDAALAATIGHTEETLRVQRVSDLLGMYHSAAVEPTGIGMIAGTGAVAARISALQVERVVDGIGWLLGDAGSGFWIGHRVAQAVAAQLDGTGPATSLTDLVFADLALPTTDELVEGRPADLDVLLRWVYAEAPVRLSRFAPLAFRAEPDDAVAAGIVAGAEEALARMLRAARDGHDHLPVVLGGSVLSAGILAEGRTPSASLRAELADADVRLARDGVAGAAVVGLLTEQVPVTAPVLEALQAEVTLLQGAGSAARG